MEYDRIQRGKARGTWQVVVLALLLGSANWAGGQTPIEIPQPEVWAHRISRVTWIRTPGEPRFRTLSLRIEADQNGAVTSVEMTDGPEEFRDAAMALARGWRFKPFERNGQAVPAAFTD